MQDSTFSKASALQSLTQLIKDAHLYLTETAGYSDSAASGYKRGWRHLVDFILTNNYTECNDSVVQLFLKHQQHHTLKKLSVTERHKRNGAKMLLQFTIEGKISTPSRTLPRIRPIYKFKGKIGQLIDLFLKHKQEHEGLSSIRMRCYERTLFTFLQYCKSQNLQTIQDVDLPFLLRYIQQLDTQKKTALEQHISTLRSLLKHWNKKGILAIDYSKKLPRYKKIDQAKLPSTYTKDEIEKLLTSVSRDSAIGKRNYAILVLAARLGLRASDIAFLKFNHLDWEQNTLSFHQIKTGRQLTLPILADVGNALIDYLRYGRPDSDSPFVFLIFRPPYGPFTTSNVVTHVVQRAFLKSGINIKGRRFGAHSLRHSLGFELLQQSTVLPVIAEVLGHKDTASTCYYLRIDLASMSKCVLAVPSVSNAFYEQKGGIFYG